MNISVEFFVSQGQSEKPYRLKTGHLDFTTIWRNMSVSSRSGDLRTKGDCAIKGYLPAARSRHSIFEGIRAVKTYFVRMAADGEVVGLFVAPSLVTLAGVVDECCDPTLCEYAPASMGGLMAPEATAMKWPRAMAGTATGLEQAMFSQQWEDDLGHAAGARKWKPLAPAARRLLTTLARGPEATGLLVSHGDD